MTRIALALMCALAVGGCKSHKESAATPAAEDAAAPAPTGPPRLVVLIVIDQLASWMFDRDAELATAGIRRLYDGGVVYRRARYPYASTYTASGHAALGTGAPPSESGILANEWYRRDSGKVMSAVADANSPVWKITGEHAHEGGVSAVQLEVEGVADVLRREKEGSKSVAVALKSRAAALMLGQRPDLAVWYDAAQPAMTTSAYFAPAPPAWLEKLAETEPVSGMLDYTWTPSDAALLARVTGIPDDGPGEEGEYGLGNTFPHRISTCSKPTKALRATPVGNRLTVDTAIAAIENQDLGADDIPDVLAISFSSHDYAGHSWGQESWERLDVYLDTDREIGRLLDELDARVGRDRYAVVLSSDHGATRLVEHSHEAGKVARRVMTDEIRTIAEGAVDTLLTGKKPAKGWVADTSTSNIYLDAVFAELPASQRARALDAVVTALGKVPDLLFVGRTDRLLGDCDQRTGIEAKACLSLRSGESGDIYYATDPDSLSTTPEYKAGTGHGSPNPDDTDVPVIVYAPGVSHRVVDDLVSPLQVAPTLSQLLGISAPSGARALPLR